MKLIVMNKTNLQVIQHNNVSSITFGANDFTVAVGGQSYTYAYENYNVQILW